MKLTDLGERGIIKRLGSFLEIGDDAACLKINDEFLVLTTDMIYKSTHLPEQMTYKQIGRLIVTLNLSDIAAMGAKPLAFLLSYGSSDIELDDFEKLIHAVKKQCERYDTKFVGGDTNQMDELTLSGTAVGITKKPVLRSTAEVGDVVAVTGNIGSAGIGTEILLNNLLNNSDNPVIKAALEPEPRIDEGIFLNKYAKSMTDISDSLAVSLYDIAEQSNVGIEIYLDKIPVSQSARNLAHDLNLDMMNSAIYGAGDYELLFSLSEKGFDEINSIVKFSQNKTNKELNFRENFKVTRIGKIIKGKGIFGIKNNERIKIEKGGYEHFVRQK